MSFKKWRISASNAELKERLIALDRPHQWTVTAHSDKKAWSKFCIRYFGSMLPNKAFYTVSLLRDPLAVIVADAAAYDAPGQVISTHLTEARAVESLHKQNSSFAYIAKRKDNGAWESRIEARERRELGGTLEERVMASCENDGHLWSGLDKCIFCGTARLPQTESERAGSALSATAGNKS